MRESLDVSQVLLEWVLAQVLLSVGKFDCPVRVISLPKDPSADVLGFDHKHSKNGDNDVVNLSRFSLRSGNEEVVEHMINIGRQRHGEFIADSRLRLLPRAFAAAETGRICSLEVAWGAFRTGFGETLCPFDDRFLLIRDFFGGDANAKTSLITPAKINRPMMGPALGLFKKELRASMGSRCVCTTARWVMPAQNDDRGEN